MNDSPRGGIAQFKSVADRWDYPEKQRRRKSIRRLRFARIPHPHVKYRGCRWPTPSRYLYLQQSLKSE